METNQALMLLKPMNCVSDKGEDALEIRPPLEWRIYIQVLQVQGRIATFHFFFFFF